MSNHVSLSILSDPGTDNDILRSLFANSTFDLHSLAELEDRSFARPDRVLTRRAIKGHHVLEARSGEAWLIILSGRAEVVPLSTDMPVELVGEGQAWRIDSGASVGLRPSASSTSVDAVEIAFSSEPMQERADRADELNAVKQLADYYYGYSDRYAQVYAAGAEGWEPSGPNDVLVHALEKMNIGPCGVIDLGCGEGRDSIYLASLGFDVVAVDVARPALEMGRKRAESARLDVSFLERDIVTLRDLPRENFDLAINMGCLHMIPDADLRKEHLTHVFDILRPGGIFILAHCREKWLQGFFSVPDYESVGPVVPGRTIPRRIRLKNGDTSTISLPLLPYQESSDAELMAELCDNGFQIMADLSMQAEAFGNTVVIAAQRPETA